MPSSLHAGLRHLNNIDGIKMAKTTEIHIIPSTEILNMFVFQVSSSEGFIMFNRLLVLIINDNFINDILKVTLVLYSRGDIIKRV